MEGIMHEEGDFLKALNHHYRLSSVIVISQFMDEQEAQAARTFL